jgi:hypothetical protein
MVGIILQGIAAVATAALVCGLPVVWLNPDAKVWVAEVLERIAALFTAGAETLRDHSVAQRTANQVYEAVLAEKQRARIQTAAASAALVGDTEAAGESSAPAALQEVA